jgi:hypothetical protein
MAHWGIAMTSFQPLWHPTSKEDLERGKAAVDAAQAIGAPTEREQAYIAAVAAFFTTRTARGRIAQSDHEARVKAWKKPSASCTRRYLEDVDAAAFYALAEVCYAMTQFSPGEERDYSQERRAGALARRYLEDHPRHPGCSTTSSMPTTARSWRTRPSDCSDYAQLAPDSPHALHMPSHIFRPLGHWEGNRRVERAFGRGGAAPDGH